MVLINMPWLGFLRSEWKNNGMRWGRWVRRKGAGEAQNLLPCDSSILPLPFLVRRPKEGGQKAITEPSFISV